jgi:tetratricopeptide (TPR) repeat protein
MSSNSNIESLKPRGFFSLVAQSFGIFFGKFGTVMGIALAVLFPLIAVQTLGNGLNLFDVLSRQNPDAPVAGLPLMIAGICSGVLALALGLLFPWMEGALTHHTIERVLGKAPGIGESYRAVRPLYGSLWLSLAVRQVGLALLGLIAGALLATTVVFAGNMAGFGLVFDQSYAITLAVISAALCAPVSLVVLVLLLLLDVNWSLRASAVVGEGAEGMQALGRSNALVTGNRWRMLLRRLPFVLLNLIFVSLPAMVISAFVTGSAFGAAPALASSLPLIAGLLSFGALVTMLLVPFETIFLALNYIDLRVRAEGLAEQLKMAGAPAVSAIAQPIERAVASSTFAAPLTPAQKIGMLYNRLRTEGESASVLKELGRSYREVGDLPSAQNALERARAAAPADAQAALELTRIYLARKLPDAARGTVRDYLTLEKDAVAADAVRNSREFEDLFSEPEAEA